MSAKTSTLERAETNDQKAGAETPAFSMSDVMATLMDLSGQFAENKAEMAELRQMVGAARAAAPTMAPANPLNQRGARDALRLQAGVPGIDAAHVRQLPVGVHGRYPGDAAMASYPQRFFLGDRVVINRDACRGTTRTEVSVQVTEKHDIHGVPYQDKKEIKEHIPMTWGEVLDGLPRQRCPFALRRGQPCRGIVNPGESCEACGWAPVISRVEFMNVDGQWVYRVLIPGVTTWGDGATGMSFQDYELQSAP